MKKKILYTLIIIQLFSLNFNKAYASCTEEEKNKFKEVEDSYSITYKYDKQTESYNLELSSSVFEYENFIYKIYSQNAVTCENDENIINCTNVKPGKYTFDIVGNTESCDDILKSFDLKLDEYNKYSEDPLCQGYEEFYLCQTTYDKQVDYETFVSRINTYRKNHPKVEEPELIPQEENLIKEYANKTLTFLKENILSIIVIGVFIILVIITIVTTIKSFRKSRRLE